MRFVFVLFDELGVASQADVMFDVEIIFRARRQAVRTEFSSSGEKQMPRDPEGGEQYRVQIEPVIIRIAPVHVIIISAHPSQKDHGDQDRKNNDLAEHDPTAVTVLHVCEAIHRNRNGPGDFGYVVLVAAGEKPGKGGHGSGEHPEKKRNRGQGNQYDAAEQKKIKSACIHISTEWLDRWSKIHRSQRNGKDQPGDPPWSDDLIQSTE